MTEKRVIPEWMEYVWSPEAVNWFLTNGEGPEHPVFDAAWSESSEGVHHTLVPTEQAIYSMAYRMAEDTRNNVEGTEDPDDLLVDSLLRAGYNIGYLFGISHSFVNGIKLTREREKKMMESFVYPHLDGENSGRSGWKSSDLALKLLSFPSHKDLSEEAAEELLDLILTELQDNDVNYAYSDNFYAAWESYLSSPRGAEALVKHAETILDLIKNLGWSQQDTSLILELFAMTTLHESFPEGWKQKYSMSADYRNYPLPLFGASNLFRTKFPGSYNSLMYAGVYGSQLKTNKAVRNLRNSLTWADPVAISDEEALERAKTLIEDCEQYVSGVQQVRQGTPLLFVGYFLHKQAQLVDELGGVEIPNSWVRELM